MMGKPPRKFRKLDREGGSKEETFKLVDKPKMQKKTIRAPVDVGPMRQSERSSTVATKMRVQKRLEEDEIRRVLALIVLSLLEWTVTPYSHRYPKRPKWTSNSGRRRSW